jgi:CDP-diacylglycerol--glycerol-3-phosphate 3-phosphatidyltransferase
VGREIVISALREWMAEMGARASVAVSYIGKVKTTAQMASIIVLLAFNPHTQAIFTLFGQSVFMMCGFALLYTAAILTLWSMVLYIKAALPTLLAEDSK